MIRKVKVKGVLVEIHREDIAGSTTKETVFKCTEKPHPDLVAIFVALEKVARKILEIPDGCWIARMAIEGVSWSLSETTGVRGAILTGKVELDESNSPFCFNTPHLPFDQYSEGGEAPLFPEEGIALLERLESEAAAYMDGTKRAQLELVGMNS